MQESTNTTGKPSRQFLIRGGIALGIVAIILVVQTNWFRAIIHKKPKAPIATPQTVGDIVGADSNKNGIPDWEEKLWGLDPTVLYTNGVPNKQIIEEKKKALGLDTANSADNQPQNETDELARQLITITTALGQNDQISDDDLKTIAAKLADSIEFQSDSAHYSLKDLQTVPTTKASLATYYNAVSAVAARYETPQSDLDIITHALETGDMSGLSQLVDMKAQDRQYAQALIAVPVPVGVENYHLEMANDVYGLSTAIGYFAQLQDNSANALAGVALYKIYDQKLTATLGSIKDYLTRYGILIQ